MAYSNTDKLYHGYIYIINNGINNKNYIGQTTTNIHIRWSQHVSAAKNKVMRNEIYSDMNKYGIENFNISILEEVCSETKDDLIDKLNYLEIKNIKELNTLEPNGYNVTVGGGNIVVDVGIKIDAYTVDGELYKTYDSAVEASLDTSSYCASSCILACCNGEMTHSHGFIFRYHGHPFDEFKLPSKRKTEQINNCQMVDKYDLEGNYISTYNSVIEIGRELGLENTSHICECCSGKVHYFYGYVWRYHGEPFDKYPVRGVKLKAVNMLDINTKEIIKTFDCIRDALMYLGKDPHNGNIGQCCKHNRPNAYGYCWEYAI